MYLFLRIIFAFLCISLFSVSATTIKDAKRAYAQKQYQKAIKLFTEYAKGNPSDGEPYMLMGYIYESQKDFPRSMAMFRRAVELKLNVKQRKTSYLKIILFYNYHQAWDIVTHYANKFLKIDPENKEVNKLRDRAIANKGHDPGTLTITKPEDIKTKQKKHIEEQERLALEKLELEKEKERVHEREKEQAKLEKESQKKSKESSEDTNWELSLKYFKIEDYNKADKIMQNLLIQSPNNKNYLYKAGIAKLRLGEYEKAIKYFESSKKFTDENDKKLLYYINLNQGQANQKLGNFNTAIALYKKAYQYNNSPILLPVLLKLYYDNGYYGEALKTADSILKTNTKNLEANMYKSLALIHTGEKNIGYKNLLDFTKRINRLYPNISNVPEKYHDGLLQTGVFYSNRIKYKLALKYLTSVSSTKSSYPKFNFALGKTYFYTQKYNLAVVFLEKNPEISAGNYLLAKYYAKEKNIIKAKEYLAKAANNKPIYWFKVKVDPYFLELMKNPDFLSFIDSKGVVQPSTTPNEKETIIPKIDPPASKPDPIPTKGANPTQPTIEPIPSTNTTPNIPGNPKLDIN